VAVFVASVACSREEADFQPIQPLEVHASPDSTSPVLETLPTGARIHTRSLGLFKPKGWLSLTQTPGIVPGFVERAGLAPFPLSGAKRFVAKDGVPLLALAQGALSPMATDAPRYRALNLGDEVTALESGAAAPWIPSGHFALINEGALVGFVPVAELATQLPGAKEFLDVALEHLKKGGGASEPSRNVAALVVQACLRAHPEEPIALRLQAALAELGSAAAPPAEALKRLPALPALPEPVPAAPLSPGLTGQVAYVASTSARLRATADASAKALTTLLINHPVLVSGIEGDWASVTTSTGHVGLVEQMEQQDELTVKVIDGAEQKGFVAARLLSLKPTSAAELKAAASQAEASHDPASALVLLRRALALNPSDEIVDPLVNASFEAGRFDVLVEWLKMPSRSMSAIEQEEHASERSLEITLITGCHGDLTKVKLHDYSLFATAGEQAKPPRMSDLASFNQPAILSERDACLAGLDLRPPCKRAFQTQDCPSDRCDRERRKIEAAAEVEYQQAVKPYRRWGEKLQERFGKSGAFVRLVPEELMRRAGGTEPEQITFYSLPFKLSHFAVVKVAAPQPEALLVRKLHLPLVPLDQLVVFVSVPGALGHEYGMAFAAPQEVEDWMKKSIAQKAEADNFILVSARDETAIWDDQDPSKDRDGAGKAPFPTVWTRGALDSTCADWGMVEGD
jgi:hypothetical protein